MAAAMEESGVVVSGGTVASWVASGVVLLSTAFVLLRALFPKRSCDFCNRAVSTMHAVAAVCLACLSVDDWSCPVCPLAAASSPSQVPRPSPPSLFPVARDERPAASARPYYSRAMT